MHYTCWLNPDLFTSFSACIIASSFIKDRGFRQSWYSTGIIFGVDLITSPPEGVARYCFHHVCLSVCLCVSVRLCVCPANILVFYFSTIRRDIDLYRNLYRIFTYRVVLNSLEKMTFIGQRSRSQPSGVIARCLGEFLWCSKIWLRFQASWGYRKIILLGRARSHDFVQRHLTI